MTSRAVMAPFEVCKRNLRAPLFLSSCAEVARGIEARAGFVNHAAKINVRADFAAQFVSGNDAQLVIELALDKRGGLFVAIEVRLLASHFEVAAARKVTVDIFFAHDLLDAIDGFER